VRCAARAARNASPQPRPRRTGGEGHHASKHSRRLCVWRRHLSRDRARLLA
jgi:hypothetical protein